MVKLTASRIEKALIIIVLIIAVVIVYHFHHKMYNQMETFDTSPVQNTKGTPVLMLFFSHFCGASRKFLPVWEQLVKKYANDANNGKLIIMKVDVDKDLQLANKYKAATLPTIILQTSDNQVLKYFGSDNLPEVESFLKRNRIL
jgi:thioredoxin 1